MLPVNNPPTPYNVGLSGGLRKGQIIYISGIPGIQHGLARGFTVNFCVGSVQGDLAFHFDVRFSHSDGLNKAIVRNTRENGKWRIEERDTPAFPFQPGVNFEMKISIDNKRFTVVVNDRHLVEYSHRILPLSKVNHLNIDGDIKLGQIKMQ